MRGLLFDDVVGWAHASIAGNSAQERACSLCTTSILAFACPSQGGRIVTKSNSIILLLLPAKLSAGSAPFNAMPRSRLRSANLVDTNSGDVSRHDPMTSAARDWSPQIGNAPVEETNARVGNCRGSTSGATRQRGASQGRAKR